MVRWLLEALLAKLEIGWSQGHPTNQFLMCPVSCGFFVYLYFISLKKVNIFFWFCCVNFTTWSLTCLLRGLFPWFLFRVPGFLVYLVTFDWEPFIVPEALFVEVSWGLGRRYFISERIYLCFFEKPTIQLVFEQFKKISQLMFFGSAKWYEFGHNFGQIMVTVSQGWTSSVSVLCVLLLLFQSPCFLYSCLSLL